MIVQITMFSAEDIDAGSNQELTYRFMFQSPVSHFTIDREFTFMTNCYTRA